MAKRGKKMVMAVMSEAAWFPVPEKRRVSLKGFC